MFESNNNEDSSKNVILKRNVSSGGITENEGILPSLRFDNADDIGLPLSYQYGNNNYFGTNDGQKPPSLSLLNETLVGDGNSLPAGFMSLMNDQNRTPLGLMQEDFPATPSSLYSNRLLTEQFETDMQAAELKVVSITDDSSSSFLPGNGRTSSGSVLPNGNVDDQLEQAAKSLQSLYVGNPELSPLGGATPSTGNALLGQYHAPLHTSASPFFTQSGTPGPTTSTPSNSSNVGSSSILGNSQNFIAPNTTQTTSTQDSSILFGQNGTTSSNSTSSANPSVMSGHAPGLDPNASIFNGVLPGGNSGITVPAFMPSATPTAGTNAANNSSTYQTTATNASGMLNANPPAATNGMMLPGVPPVGANGAQMPMPAGPNQLTPQQQQFFMTPPAIYMNPANGQPMFFRPPGQFGQDASAFMYPQLDANGMPIAGTMDPAAAAAAAAQMQFAQQQFAQQGFMQFPGMMPGGMIPPAGFWPAAGATDQQGNAIPGMYQQPMGMQQGPGGVDDRNRMMYNPAAAAAAAAAMFQNMPAAAAAAAMAGVPPNARGNGTMPFNMNAAGMMQMPMGGPNGPIMQRPMMPMNADGTPSFGMMAADPNMMMAMPRMGMGMGDDGSGMAMGNNMMMKGRGDHHNNNNNGNNGSNGNNGGHHHRNNNNDNMMSGGNNNRHYNNNGNNNHMNNNMNNNRNNNGNNNGSGDRNGGGRNFNNMNNNNMGNNMNNNHNNNNMNNNNGNNNNNNNMGGSNAVRDTLVEEFRSTFGKSRQWTLSDLTNHIVAFCQDQHGSRFIQQRLEVCTDSEKQLVFDEILPSAQILMTDVFGNYVLQKLFEYGNKDQCESLALLLKGQAVNLSMQMYGCRVVQKALEYVNTERLVDLVSEFESPQMLIRCVHDSNGNHVIQKCIEVVSKAAKDALSKSPPDTEHSEYLSSRIQFIINAFTGHVKELSSHPYGCRVVQRILEHCTNNQKAVILEELRQCCSELVQDCYGNYVIQFVMQHGWDADRAVLIREVQSNLLDFSQHKFASNVVEKCLQYASKKDRDEMIWTIINVTFDLNNPVDAKGHCVLESMVRDPYANYVVQKVIDVSDERQRGAIMRYVKDNINQLRKYTYGKHIIVRLEKITNEKF